MLRLGTAPDGRAGNFRPHVRLQRIAFPAGEAAGMVEIDQAFAADGLLPRERKPSLRLWGVHSRTAFTQGLVFPARA
jgi:hypothetical protein